jgi:ATP-binding cassette subfamily F protein 3
MFLHALADRLIVFTDDGPEIFEGGYGEFLEKGGWRDENDKPDFDGKSEKQQKTADKLNKKEIRKLRSEIISERSKLLKPLEKRIKKTENTIDAHEKEIERLNREMIQASQAGDGEKIGLISRAIHECEDAIEKGFEQLEILTEQFETGGAEFERRLGELEKAGEF